MAEGGRYGTAICSVGNGKDDYPRGQVSNAFTRRGYPVYVTRGSALLHYSGVHQRGWGDAVPVAFASRVEDKAKPAAAA
jgi:hypothetical protein